MKKPDQRPRLILIVFASFLITSIAVLLTTPARPATKPTSYTYDDARARPQESAQEKARREWQERWPEMKHCRLPACSTK